MGGFSFPALGIRNYRLFASGQLVSVTGTWMQRVAQDWLVLELTSSGTALGIVTALQFGPSLLLSPFGGVLADRGNKRKLLIATQTAIALLALLLGLLDLSGAVRLWQVYLVALVLGVVAAIDMPVRQSFVVEMVGPGELSNAVALNSAIFNSGRILGPALSGFLITVAGTGWSFLANAASTVAVLAGLLLMRTGDLFPSPPVERARGQLREAVRYVRRRPELMLPMLLVFVIGTFGLSFQITLALVAREVFHRSAQSYGFLSTMLAIGSFVGAMLATRRRTTPSTTFLLGSALAFGVFEMIAGSIPSYAGTAIALVPAGLAALTFTTAALSTVQLRTDGSMRGRVMALYMVAFMGGTPVGAPVIGWIGETFGPRFGIVGGGAICVLASLLITIHVARRRGLGAADVAHRALDGIRHVHA